MFELSFSNTSNSNKIILIRTLLIQMKHIFIFKENNKSVIFPFSLLHHHSFINVQTELTLKQKMGLIYKISNNYIA